MQSAHQERPNGTGVTDLMQVVSALAAKLEAEKMADNGVQQLVTGELAQKLEAIQLEQSRMQAAHDQLQHHLSRSREGKLQQNNSAVMSSPDGHKHQVQPQGVTFKPQMQAVSGQPQPLSNQIHPGGPHTGNPISSPQQDGRFMHPAAAAHQLSPAGVNSQMKVQMKDGQLGSPGQVHLVVSAQGHTRNPSQSSDVSLHKAAQTGNLEDIKRLVAMGRSLESREGNRGQTPLHFAAKGGSTAAAQLLLQLGSDMNARDKNFLTPLHWASSEEMVEVLIAAGADANVPDKLGSTPVHYSSVDPKKVAVLRKLLERGAEVNARNAYGRTPMHKAAEKGSLEAVKVLIACKADVNCRDQDGDTPLHCAAVNGHLKVVETLVEAGAVVSYKNKEGLSAVSMAGAGGRHPEVAKFLMKASLREQPEKGAVLDTSTRTELVQHVKAMLRDLHLPREIASKIAEYTAVSLKNGALGRSPRAPSPRSHSRGNSRDYRDSSRSHRDQERYSEREARYTDPRDPRRSPHKREDSRERLERQASSGHRRRGSGADEVVDRLSHLVSEWERADRRDGPPPDVLTRQRSRDQDSDRGSVASVRSHGSNSSRPPSVPRDSSRRHTSAPRDRVIREGRGRDRSTEYRRDGSRDSRDSRDSYRSRDEYERAREVEYHRARSADHHRSHSDRSHYRRDSSRGREDDRRTGTYADDRESARRREHREREREREARSHRPEHDKHDRLTEEEVRKLKAKEYQKVVERKRPDERRLDRSHPAADSHRSPQRVSPSHPQTTSPPGAHPAIVSAPIINPFSSPQQHTSSHSSDVHTAPPKFNFFSPNQLPPGTGMIFGAPPPFAQASLPASLASGPPAIPAPSAMFSAPVATLQLPSTATPAALSTSPAKPSTSADEALSPAREQQASPQPGELRLPTPELKRTQETHVNKLARIQPLHTAPASMTTLSEGSSISTALTSPLADTHDTATTAQSAGPIFGLKRDSADQSKPSPDMLPAKARAPQRESPLDARRGRRPTRHTQPATPPKNIVFALDQAAPTKSASMFASPPADPQHKTVPGLAPIPDPTASASPVPKALTYKKLQPVADPLPDTGPFGKIAQEKSEINAAGAPFQPGALLSAVAGLPTDMGGAVAVPGGLNDGVDVFTPGQARKLRSWLSKTDGAPPAPHRSVSAPPSMPPGRLPSDGSSGQPYDPAFDPGAPVGVPGPRLMHSADGLPTIGEEGDDSVRWPSHLRVRTRPLSPEEEVQRQRRLKAEAAAAKAAGSPAGKGGRSKGTGLLEALGFKRAGGKAATKVEETEAVEAPAPAAIKTRVKTPMKVAEADGKQPWWKPGARKKSSVSMDAVQGAAAAEAAASAAPDVLHQSLPDPITTAKELQQKAAAGPSRPSSVPPPTSPSEADSWETMSNPEVIPPGSTPPAIRYVWRSKSEEKRRPSKVCCAAPVAQL